MAKKEKVVNYTPEMEARLKEVYDPNADQDTRDEQVAALAVELDKKPQSIRAKLVRMELYVAKEYRSKTGKKPVKKEDMVNEIASRLGILPEVMDSLTKANASVINSILTVVRQFDDLSKYVTENQEVSE